MPDSAEQACDNRESFPQNEAAHVSPVEGYSRMLLSRLFQHRGVDVEAFDIIPLLEIFQMVSGSTGYIEQRVAR